MRSSCALLPTSATVGRISGSDSDRPPGSARPMVISGTRNGWQRRSESRAGRKVMSPLVTKRARGLELRGLPGTAPPLPNTGWLRVSRTVGPTTCTRRRSPGAGCAGQTGARRPGWVGGLEQNRPEDFAGGAGIDHEEDVGGLGVATKSLGARPDRSARILPAGAAVHPEGREQVIRCPTFVCGSEGDDLSALAGTFAEKLACPREL